MSDHDTTYHPKTQFALGMRGTIFRSWNYWHHQVKQRIRYILSMAPCLQLVWWEAPNSGTTSSSMWFMNWPVLARVHAETALLAMCLTAENWDLIHSSRQSKCESTSCLSDKGSTLYTHCNTCKNGNFITTSYNWLDFMPRSRFNMGWKWLWFFESVNQ